MLRIIRHHKTAAARLETAKTRRHVDGRRLRVLPTTGRAGAKADKLSVHRCFRVSRNWGVVCFGWRIMPHGCVQTGQLLPFSGTMRHNSGFGIMPNLVKTEEPTDAGRFERGLPRFLHVRDGLPFLCSLPTMSHGFSEIDFLDNTEHTQKPDVAYQDCDIRPFVFGTSFRFKVHLKAI